MLEYRINFSFQDGAGARMKLSEKLLAVSDEAAATDVIRRRLPDVLEGLQGKLLSYAKEGAYAGTIAVENPYAELIMESLRAEGLSVTPYAFDPRHDSMRSKRIHVSWERPKEDST
jgi:hypothetical protein